jgi:hypothetical protein
VKNSRIHFSEADLPLLERLLEISEHFDGRVLDTWLAWASNPGRTLLAEESVTNWEMFLGKQ